MSFFSRQMFEAAAWTFLQAFLAALAPAVAGMQYGDWAALEGFAAAAALAGVAAVLSLFKSVIVRNLGEKDTVFISHE